MKEQSQQDNGTFGTYLDLLQQKRSSEQGHEDIFMRLLTQLSETEAKPIPEIAAASGMPVNEFAESLGLLETLDMIVIKLENDTKVIALTSGGADYVSAQQKDK